MHRASFRSALACGAAIGFFAVASTAAWAQGPTHSFKVPSQPLGEAVRTVGKQAGVNILFNPRLAAGRAAPALNGEMTVEQALARLFTGVDVRFETTAPGSIAVLPGASPLSGAYSDEDAEKRVEAPVEVETVTVTGTNIRGVGPSSSPLLVFGREEIERTGASTLQQFVQTLPQNFAGGSNEADFTGTPTDQLSTRNTAIGASVNLRGLGSGSTLVLVNGRRLAPSSTAGDFVDISMIPLNAVKRVEMLTDGASSVYGGDAVAGVVNFILRDDYDGVETYASYGGVTKGDLEETRFGVTMGKSWDTGNVMLVLDAYERDALNALDRDFYKNLLGVNPAKPIDILPAQDRKSALLTLRQDLNDSVRLWGDLMYSQREAAVNRSQTPAAAQPVYRRDSFSEQGAASTGVTVALPRDWSFDASAGASYAFTRNTPKLASQTQTKTRSNMWSLDAKVSGPLFSLPAGEVKMAAGVSFRDEAIRNNNIRTGALTGTADRTINAQFVELVVPILETVEMNLSARRDDYSDFGDTTNPKVGLMWEPVEGLKLRGSWSTAFNPPDLGLLVSRNRQINVFTNDYLNSLLATNSPKVPNSSPAFFIIENDPALKPETSEAFTAGFDFKHDFGSGRLKVSSTYFDITYEDRINQIDVPGGFFNIFNIGLSNPSALPPGVFIQNPSTALVNELIATSLAEGGFINSNNFYTGNPASVGLIAFIRTTNLSKQVARGLDLDLGWDFETDMGQFGLSLSASYLLDFQIQNSSATAQLEKVNTVFRPVDLNARAGVTWRKDGLSAALFVNYTGDYKDDRYNPARPIPSWTTADVNLGWDLGSEPTIGALRNMRFALTVTNLFDNEPPSVAEDFSFGLLRYDPTNADPLGRFVSLRVTKSW